MKCTTYLPLLIAMLLSNCERSVTVTPTPTEDDSITNLPEKVTFNAHIRPIFSDTCFACHGFDANKREADLRLDTPEGAYAKLKDSDQFAIVPWKPDESAILERIVSNSPKDVMPPPEFHKDLSEHQKSLIRKWIEQGAKYEQHWAFTPIDKPEVPGNSENPIDSFVLATLTSHGVTPSSPAPKSTLLRRLSLDLTGLPPTPAELANFLADESPTADEKQVDRLIASPHYGERMAVPWLDVVRFADTVGYHGDQNARIFPYRDYVINAFNDNKPFNEFTTEQLAGDLLPQATDKQRIATGFLRLNLMTREGGAQTGEYLAKYMADRVRAVGAAWLGLTTGCAECHDHKFDPMTSRDFYSLGAFFADLRQWGVYSHYNYSKNTDLKGFNINSPFPPEIHCKSPALERRIANLQESATKLLADTQDNTDAPGIAAWSESNAVFLSANPTGWATLTPAEISANKGTSHEILTNRSVVFTGSPQQDETLTLTFSLPPHAVRTIRFEALPDSRNSDHVGRRDDGKFAVTPEFSIRSGNSTTPLKVAWSQADRRTPHNYKNGDSIPLLEPEWRSAPAAWEEPRNAASLPQTALYHLEENLPAESGRTLLVKLASADIGKVRFGITPFGGAIPGRKQAIPDETKTALLTPHADRDKSQLEALTAACIQATTPDAELPEDFKNIRDEIIACRAGYAHSLVAQSLPADQTPSTHLLPRGNWMTPGAKVQPAVPAFLPQGSLRDDGRRLTRLDLAHWLMDKENPLPARQFCNRLWKQFFGKGLSNVLDDLGNQGEWPSHPELLDWLAAEFRDSGWDVKHMVRLIVTSKTYQQTSATRPALAESDPANRLLAEQSARRLDAEFVRDNALAISGLLNTKLIGGPSAKPYQPADYYQNLNYPKRKYKASTGGNQHRRGVYTHWQRSFMHPMMAGFDAPSREECTADRFQSNSPQQALTLLNDPSFVEAARAFALRLMREKPGAGDPETIHHAFQLALAREADAEELKSLGAFLKAQREHYQNHPDDAATFLKTDLSTPGTSKDAAQLAAWTQLCRVILNLHETITRY